MYTFYFKIRVNSFPQKSEKKMVDFIKNDNNNLNK